MPVYVYAEVLDDGGRGQPFEVVQRMSDPPLRSHPESGRPVVRLLQPPSLRTSGAGLPSDPARGPADALAKRGFTRYERSGDATWTRTAGSGGPATLHKGDER